VPIYCVSAKCAFPYHYHSSEKAPLDFNDYKLSRYLLRKQTMFAYRFNDWFRFEYEADDYHLAANYSRLVETQVHAAVGYYLSSHPDSTHVSIDNVLSAFR
jgi:hypothetical protein